jgi:hypothetical protein
LLERLAAALLVLPGGLAVAQEDCCNRIDDDGDAMIDFDDADCGSHPECPTDFRRGDADLDGRTNITDVVTLLGLAYRGLPPGTVCDDARDVNDDGSLDLTDAVVLIDWLFRSGPAPPEPFFECGEDPTSDTLSGCRGNVQGC